jgi:DNA-binding MarR family transcriptional regulator
MIGLEVFEQRSACRLLVYLFRKGASPVSDIITKGDFSQTSLYNAFRKLEKADLIKEAVEGTFPRRRLISLTEKGRKVARLMEEAEKIVTGQQKLYEESKVIIEEKSHEGKKMEGTEERQSGTEVSDLLRGVGLDRERWGELGTDTTMALINKMTGEAMPEKRRKKRCN